MEVIKALTLSIGEIEQPIITRYQMGVFLHQLYRNKHYKGEPLGKLQREYAQSQDLSRFENQLIGNGVIAEITNIKHVRNVYSLIGRKITNDGDTVCSIDPFAYISHLSAMEYHGLTDRIPSKLFISSPSSSNWKDSAFKKMEKDLKGDLEVYIENGMPTLKKPTITKIGRLEVHCFNSKHQGAFVKIKDRSLRVSSIGRTFLDMLRNPELCGGIKHVLDVYAAHADTFVELIASEFEQNGSDIDKVRAGYIINERLAIPHPVVESWKKFAQRGGSRKLDASAEYHNEFSKDWCLSLNVF